MALTQKERSANCYKRRKENGLCPRCGRKLDRDGHYCSTCLGKVRESRREDREFYRSIGICPVCRKAILYGDEKTCIECRTYYAIYREKHNLTNDQKEKYRNRFKEQRRNIYWERKEKGICTKCGKRKAMGGKSKCILCLEKDAEVHRNKRESKIMKGM